MPNCMMSGLSDVIYGHLGFLLKLAYNLRKRVEKDINESVMREERAMMDELNKPVEGPADTTDVAEPTAPETQP